MSRGRGIHSPFHRDEIAEFAEVLDDSAFSFVEERERPGCLLGSVEADRRP
jgi:hypothetical protein